MTHDSASLLRVAATLIRDLDAHEGAEGWSQGYRERIDQFFTDYFEVTGTEEVDDD